MSVPLAASVSEGRTISSSSFSWKDATRLWLTARVLNSWTLAIVGAQMQSA
jgi:hypothetical protein